MGAVGSHVLTIVDDEATPTVGFDQAALTQLESGGPVTATVSLSAASGRDVTVPFTVTGTAADGADYALSSASPLVFPAGETTKALTVTPLDDALDEPLETVVLSLGAADFADAGADQTFTLSLEDDDATPTVGFVNTGSTVPEGSGTVSVAVALSAVSGQEVTVDLGLGGTATLGEDFTLPEATVVIPAGASGASLDLSPVGDALYEGPETVELQLQGAVGADADPGASTSVLTIADDDAAPVVAFTVGSSSAGEGVVDPQVIEVTLSEVSGLPASVEFAVTGDATEGVDYVLGSASPLVIAAGQTSAQIPITVLDDALDEADESVTLSLGGTTDATVGAVGSHVLTIADDDAAPILTLSAAELTVQEGAGVAPLLLLLSQPSGRAVTVSLTGQLLGASQEDFVLPTQVVIPEGMQEALVGLEAVSDGLHEGPEEMQIILGGSDEATLGAPAATLVSVADSDAPPGVSIEPGGITAAEGAGSISVAVTLSQASGLPAAVSLIPGGTATLGADYTADPLEIVFAPGETEATVLVNVVDDALYEEGESVTLALGPPAGASASGSTLFSLDITDDDPQPSLSLSLSETELLEVSASQALTLALSGPAGLDVTAELLVWHRERRGRPRPHGPDHRHSCGHHRCPGPVLGHR